MNKLLIILTILLFVIYTRYNLKYNPFTEILQIKPGQLTPAILMEKNPIIIENGFINPNDTIETSMKYLYLYFNKGQKEPSNKLSTNQAKYALIYGNGVTVEIVNPKYKNEENYPVLPIKLKHNQALILPMYWLYSNETSSIQIVYIHDMFSILYHTFKSIV